MALIGHLDVLAPQTISNNDPETTKSKLNTNFTLGESESQKIEERLEHSQSSLFGEGLLTVPTVTTSASSLQITFGAFTSLLGVYISYAGGTATVLASQTNASLYFCQDQTFATTLPATKTYFIIGTYTSDTDGVTSFTLTNKLLIPKLVTVTGTVSGVYVPDDDDTSAAQYVDHSATAIFAIDGKLKLTVSDNDKFTVSEVYPGGMLDKDSDFEHIPLHQRTDGGFWFQVVRKAAYAYAGSETCDVTYSRTGLILAT